jgi:hypothetical protein
MNPTDEDLLDEFLTETSPFTLDPEQKLYIRNSTTIKGWYDFYTVDNKGNEEVRMVAGESYLQALLKMKEENV